MAYIKKIAFALGILLSLNSFGQPRNAGFDEIYNLIEMENFFKAQDVYTLKKNSMSAEYQKFCEAFIDNAFNRLKESQKKIVSLTSNSNIPDSLKCKLLFIKTDNLVKLYDYKGAKNAIEELFQGYKSLLTAKEIDDFENELKIWSALEDIPSQKVQIKKNTNIKMQKDAVGLNNLIVSADTATVNFIFDTGANISTITQSVAKRLNVNIIPANIEVLAITGSRVMAQLGVCKKMEIENIEIRNAVFLIFPDEALAIPQANYQINGILGFPVIEAFKEVQITQDGYFIVPQKQTHLSGGSNMAISGLTSLVYIDGNHYSFDTGADKTILYNTYYQQNKTEIDKDYQTIKVGFGGAGGKAEFEGCRIDKTFHISGKKIVLKDIQLLKEKIKEDQNVYGNIGQDLIKQFHRMTLNFDKMFIKFD